MDTVILNDVEYIIEPSSNGRRVMEKNRIILQRDWIMVRTPHNFKYDDLVCGL